jgi:hypothetical protein
MYRQVLLRARGNVPTSPIAAGTTITTDTISARNGSYKFYYEVMLTGPTSQRPQHGDPDYPVGFGPGLEYYDTTISAIINWDGTTWRNAITGAAV